MITHLSLEAMELDSPSAATQNALISTSCPSPDAYQRHLAAVKKSKAATKEARALRENAKTSEEAAKRYADAQKVARQLKYERRVAKEEAGFAKVKRSRPDIRTRGKVPSASCSGGRGTRTSGKRHYTDTPDVKRSTTCGVTKKGKEKKTKPLPKPRLRAQIEHRTGTGVYVWSVAEGTRELPDDEVQMIQGMQDMRLLLPPPQMLEEEKRNGATASGNKERNPRPTRAERREMALLAAAQQSIVKVESKKDEKPMERGGQRMSLKERLDAESVELKAELADLENEQRREFQERLDSQTGKKDEVCRERRGQIFAQALSMRDDAEIDDIAEKLGLLGMGRKYGK